MGEGDGGGGEEERRHAGREEGRGGEEREREEEALSRESLALYCVVQVQHLPRLHERYWGRLDEARREAVRLRTDRRVREAML